MKTFKTFGIFTLAIGSALLLTNCQKDDFYSASSNSLEIGESSESDPTSNGLEDLEKADLETHSEVRLRTRGAGSYEIAFISDLINSSAFKAVDDVVTSNGLGNVTMISEQDVIDGDLNSGGYDLFFIGRLYPESGGSPTTVGDGFREELEIALSNCIGMVTEWQGGSPFWTDLGDQTQYYQMLDDDSSLFNWFDGTVDRGDSRWSERDDDDKRVHTNDLPGHPVMANVPDNFSLCGTEFFYRIQNPDSDLDILATVKSLGTDFPVILAGKYLGTNVVLWPSDWGDCGVTADTVRNQIIYNAIEFAGAPCDADGDGCLDVDDPHPFSNTDPTVVIDSCDSGVANVFVSDDGCSTMSDLIADAAANAKNHGEFVSAVADLTNQWKAAGFITSAEKAQIGACAAQAKIP